METTGKFSEYEQTSVSHTDGKTIQVLLIQRWPRHSDEPHASWVQCWLGEVIHKPRQVIGCTCTSVI